jgi:murein DD-endopeptidase MepM/ murein hydrolase activator NlpD
MKSKVSILTQNKFWWVLVALLLPVFGVVAAFNPSSTGEPHHLKLKTVVQQIALPQAISHTKSNAEFWQIDQIRRDDTLGSLFKRMNIHDEDAIKVLTTDPRADAINTQLIPGHSIKTKTNSAGKLLQLTYEVDNETSLTVQLTPNGYTVSTQKLSLNIRRVLKSVTIVNSLFGATDAAGIPDQIALQLADIFSSEIDFNEDLWPDDKFNVIYEAYYNAGELIKTGNILAVEFTNKGKTYQAVRFGGAEGKFAYYTPEGKSLHKSFLRSPVEFTRISSTFSTGRYHPILHRMRAHQGVDFAAPQGTRVKASGEGVVDFVGKKGGYGNVIVLKHKNGFSTVYGHLSAFAKGLRKGLKVAQSDIIGFVGMTGLATGPHLHYEFLVGKVHHDPLSVALPTSIPIDEKDRPIFNALRLDYMAQIEMLNRSQMATRD